METTKINIEEIIGHVVKATFWGTSFFGDVKLTKEGRVIYSAYQGTLMFKEKGARNKAYPLTEDKLLSVEMIRKDKKNHELYSAIYAKKEELVEREQNRQKKEAEYRRLQREKAIEEEKLRKAAKIQEEIDEADSLPGYAELKQELINYYEQEYKGEFYNSDFVLTTLAPIAQQIIHKSLPNVDKYPKYYFCKDRMHKFTGFLELKTGVKFGKTQSGNVAKLNKFLSN